MLRVPMRLARPGMVLALPVHHPRRRAQILLRAGFTLDDSAIDRLRDIRLPDLWIMYPGLDFIEKHINTDIARAQSTIVETVGDVFNSIASNGHAKLEYGKYKDVIKGFIDSILEHPQAGVLLQELGASDEPLMRHSSNVCYLSLLMGLTLEGYLIRQRRRLPAHMAKDVVNLGVGAMLHDIGMTRLERDVVERWRADGDESDPEWRRHVELGYHIVQGSVEPSAAAVVLHHHQRFDGEGFPVQQQFDGAERGLEGDRIHVFARIVAAADLFDTLRRPGGGETRVPTVRVLRTMLSEKCAGRLDPVALRALMSVAPPYPPGSLVELSDGRQAVVREWTCEDPCRPTVQILPRIEDSRTFASDDGEQEIIALTATPDLHIVMAEDEAVSEDNFAPGETGEFDIHCFERTL